MKRTVGFLLMLAAAGIALAQQEGGDPPSRVARLNYLQGSVSFRPGSVDEWTNATLNYPLYNGDHLWADAGAQSELHIGSTAVRMGSETALAILALDDRLAQLSLTGGLLNVRLRALGEGESFEIDTPNSAVTLLRPGDYRIEVDERNNLTLVTVRGGDAEVTGGGRAFAVHARDTARIMGSDDNTSSELTSAAGFDGFDRWCQDRDRRDEQSESARYVGRETIGYADLDEHGTWSQVPEYGWVWRPRVVVAGWAPYRYGHWAWVEPWGWTWIDDAPWGFAPFHYGRWAYWGGDWVWVPGTMVARPVYAPALVAWVGGPRFSMAVSFGGGGPVGWFPLGPHEVYRPAYHVSEVYVRQVNITHVNVTNINVTNVNVTNVRYVNQNVQGAVTAVPHETFAGGRSVHQTAVVVPANAVAQAQVVGAAPVAPERASVLGRQAAMGRVATPPASMAQRTVMVRNTPPAPPVSFAAKRDALQANPGRPLDPATTNTIRRNDSMRAPMVRTAPVSPANTPAAPVRQQMPQVITTTPAPRNDRPVFQQRQTPPVQQQQQSQPPQIQQQQQQPVRTEPRREMRPPQPPQPQQAAPPPRVEQRQEMRQEHRDERKQDQRKTEKKEDRKEERKQQ
jgi:hypothetical protein